MNSGDLSSVCVGTKLFCGCRMNVQTLRTSMVTLAVATMWVASPSLADPFDDDSYSGYADQGSFDGALSPYGEWVSSEPVGRVWRPNPLIVGVGFHPYVTGGYWVNTEFGWSFESDYPWGWAAFHYGRWVFDPGYGWVWVPGRVWAPAWVDWRYGAGYIGWAPLPPAGITLSFTSYHPWCFLETRYFLSRNFATYALPPQRFHAAFSVTAPFHATYHRAGASWYSGPPAGEISRYSGTPIPTAQVVPPAPGRIHPAHFGSQAYLNPSPGWRGGPPTGSVAPIQQWGQSPPAPAQRYAPSSGQYAPPATLRPKGDSGQWNAPAPSMSPAPAPSANRSHFGNSPGVAAPPSHDGWGQGGQHVPVTPAPPPQRIPSGSPWAGRPSPTYAPPSVSHSAPVSVPSVSHAAPAAAPTGFNAAAQPQSASPPGGFAHGK